MTETPNITSTKYLLLVLLVSIAVVTAVIPNIGQQLYDQGLSFPVIDVLKTGSYLVFAVTLIGAWQILKGSRAKWLLLVLIPVAYFQPLLWGVALFAWSTGGFAPGCRLTNRSRMGRAKSCAPLSSTVMHQKTKIGIIYEISS